MTVLDMASDLKLEEEAHRQRVSGEASAAMEHSEAIEMMASERYLLDELTPELRDAYEEHFFGCPECALDVRLGATFIDQAKLILPDMISSQAIGRAAAGGPEEANQPLPRKVKEKRDWFMWLRPAIMVPAFACLLAVVGYQNLVVYPALQAAASEPRILPLATFLHDGTRSAIPAVYADLKLGTTITIELPAGANYASYKLEFYNSKGEIIATRTAPADTRSDDTLSFWLSSSVKLGTYKLVLSGITPTGETVSVKQQLFDLQPKK